MVALITPWNWPINQVVCKVAPALAAGCTMVLKPSEIAPINALLFADVMHEAGVPPGVFNLINGDGPTVGAALSAHPQVDMVSFTGSTRAGIEIARLAAPTVKRVHQELGGKSANILLDDVDLQAAVTNGVNSCFGNSGQSCNAPTRMLVPARFHDEAVDIARRAAQAHVVGAPDAAATTLGPVISERQYDSIQRLIGIGIEEGAQLVCGGLGRPEHLAQGYYVQPTIFANVTQDMTIAREEIFGPVLVIQAYENEAQAVSMANDSVFGLAAYVQSADRTRARDVALQMRAGSVYINYPNWDSGAPFGGYKQSGNGREYAEWGLEAFLEVKGIVGWGHSPRSYRCSSVCVLALDIFASALIRSATRSAIIRVGTLVFAQGIDGIREASHTRSPWTPITLASPVVTACGSSARPMRQVPEGCQVPPTLRCTKSVSAWSSASSFFKVMPCVTRP